MRIVVALVVATALHGLALLVLRDHGVRLRPDPDEDGLTITIAPLAPRAVERPPPPSAVALVEPPPAQRTPQDEPPPTPAAGAEQSSARDEGASDVDTAPAGPRIRPSEDEIAAIIRGTASGPAPSLATLERATGIRVPGGESDDERAERLAKARLETDIASHNVARGLTDDWFRRRRDEIERMWRPHGEELIDGGKETRAAELLMRTAANPLLWKEAGEAIWLDLYALSRQFSMERSSALQEMLMLPSGKVETDVERREQFVQALTTNRGAFETSVGLEVRVRHRADGSVELIDVIVRSGHVHLDEGAVDAVARALAADLADRAPVAVAKGKPFASRWAVQVRWRVIPPKCLFTGVAVACGGKFGPDGVEIPLTMKKETSVELVTIHEL